MIIENPLLNGTAIELDGGFRLPNIIDPEGHVIKSEKETLH